MNHPMIKQSLDNEFKKIYCIFKKNLQYIFSKTSNVKKKLVFHEIVMIDESF